MKPLLKVDNLSVLFKKGDKEPPFTAVDNISFQLNSGEILGIVGESGSGKSVTALSLLGLLPYPRAFHTPQSSIKLSGDDILTAPVNILQKIRGGKVGFVFQEPMSSLNPLHKIGDQIKETILLHTEDERYRNGDGARAKALELLEIVGIKNAASRYNSYPYELSGGQRQRVMIAMAIANNPEILIADEPTTALDVTVQEQIIKLLIKLKNKFKMSIIFISHDLNLVHKIADRILVMYQGKIVESGKSEDVFLSPHDPYTKKLIESSLSLKNNENIGGGVAISVEGVCVEFPVKKSFWGRVTQSLKAVDNVSLNIYQGETLGVVGESGSGKTTLGMCLAKLMRCKGEINLNKSHKNKEFRRKVQIVFQDPYNSLNPRLNILQTVEEGLRVHFPALNETQRMNKVVDMLENVGLSQADLYKYPHEFSGGQRQRIAIARALILSPEVVVLDEPTSALDITVQIQIIELLKKLQKQMNVTYVFISHDIRAIKSIAHRIAVMKDGKIVELGTADDIFNNPQVDYTKELIRASLLNGLN